MLLPVGWCRDLGCGTAVPNIPFLCRIDVKVLLWLPELGPVGVVWSSAHMLDVTEFRVACGYDFLSLLAVFFPASSGKPFPFGEVVDSVFSQP